jgi:hypothetical protein
MWPAWSIRFEEWVLKKWVIGAVVIALAAWLIQFSTHIHLPDSEEDLGSTSSAHVCVYCAALQPGAGPASVTVHIAPAAAAGPSPEPVQTFLPSSASTPYRSRAPPAA